MSHDRSGSTLALVSSTEKIEGSLSVARQVFLNLVIRYFVSFLKYQIPVWRKWAERKFPAIWLWSGGKKWADPNLFVNRWIFSTNGVFLREFFSKLPVKRSTVVQKDLISILTSFGTRVKRPIQFCILSGKNKEGLLG